MQRNLRIDLKDGIAIRPAESIDDYRACQEAQRRAWGISDDNYLIPIATLVGAQHHGGLVLGAFQEDGTAVAMSFAFLGRLKRQICLYSQLTGVIPEFQSLGLGKQIKLLQRQFARDEGIARVAWAFDPLQAGNARFNLNKLGATSSQFIENMYGLRTDPLNSGVPTDRLIAEWPVEPDRRLLVPESTQLPFPDLIPTERSTGHVPVPLRRARSPETLWVRLRIPIDIKTLREDDPDLAEAWRVAVKEAFQYAFKAGYQAVRFYQNPQIDGADMAYYLLHR